MPTDIIIVDEEPAVARALARELKRCGVLARTFTKEVEAFEALRTESAAVLVYELRSEALHEGLEFLARVMKHAPQVARCGSSTQAKFIEPSILMPVRLSHLLNKPWTANDLDALKRLAAAPRAELDDTH